MEDLATGEKHNGKEVDIPKTDDSLYEEEFRDSLSTLDEHGNRRWIFPKKPKGKYTNARIGVSIFLLAILFGAPFIKIDGEPFLLANFFERKFVIFGQVFWPQDFHLFVLGMISLVVFIVLFTVVYGRIFCGWVCPQTIFMEMVFRRIEYWIEGDWTAQKRLRKQPWDTNKIIKKGSKHLIFVAISFLIMHTLMSYIIGIEKTFEVISSPPGENLAGFIAMMAFTGIFYYIFSTFREQVCTNVCPYGRLQGVLLDRNSVVISYDYKRGEKRAKYRKDEDRSAVGKGDCIDCKQCIYVCPTGIDIRNGTQLECVNCTACIDACDEMMDKVDLPRGLIRYAAESNVADGKKFKFTGRMKAYSAVLVALIGVLITLLLIRTDIETTILRTSGIMFQEREDNKISNLYNYNIVNKTNKHKVINLELLDKEGAIEVVGKTINITPQSVAEGALFVVFDRDDLTQMSTKIKIGVFSSGELMQTVNTRFLGP